jgi:cyclase
MLKKRIIPFLTANNISLVKTKGFNDPRMIGNPVQSARIFTARNADELVFVDIYAGRKNQEINTKLVAHILRECDIPLTVGGGIKRIETAHELFKIGTDKILLRSSALNQSLLPYEITSIYGKQSLVIALDVFMDVNGEYVALQDSSNTISLERAIKIINLIQPGEVVVTSVDKEGYMNGMDINLLKRIKNKIKSPIIFNGGVSKPSDVVEAFIEFDGLSAIGASSIFQYTQYNINDVKENLNQSNFNVRML